MAVINELLCKIFGHKYGPWVDGARNTGSEFYQYRECQRCGDVHWGELCEDMRSKEGKREITLPIKCSTVKKYHAMLCNLIEIEISAITVLIPISVIFDCYMIMKYPIVSASWAAFAGSPHGTLSLLLRAVASIVLALIGMFWIAENLPDIKCIQDEEP